MSFNGLNSRTSLNIERSLRMNTAISQCNPANHSSEIFAFIMNSVKFALVYSTIRTQTNPLSFATKKLS